MAQDISEFKILTKEVIEKCNETGDTPYGYLVDFYKNRKQGKVWWTGILGELCFPYFSFDKKTIYNLGVDYPYNLTTEQKKAFDEENPFWRDFFAWRCE